MLYTARIHTPTHFYSFSLSLTHTHTHTRNINPDYKCSAVIVN